MRQVKALVGELVQNPVLLRGLIEDPQRFAQLAGLGEAELRALSGVRSVVTGMLSRLSGPNSPGPAEPRPSAARALASPKTNSRQSRGESGVAIASVVSLLAVAGAVAALGTVSLVALAHEDRRRTP